ncbi:MAG TPA: RNB domain-containing ribonuclease [Rhabdochlamydiaceae bacterium]|nr:RNB domain-containing ribonuclease [Rhabdochlamydiaceae bacterium]
MSVDLSALADQVMIEKGFIPAFPEAALQELKPIQSAPLDPSMRDMRDLLWVSIDNDDSLDLDQLTYAESDKIYVAVADVSGLVKKGSALDEYAGHNTTSVYTPTKIFPMLPPKLSNDLTSLNENSDRSSIVIEMQVHADGSFSMINICQAIVRNKAKLTYNGVAAFLNSGAPLSNPAANDAIKDQLKLQDSIAQRMHAYRISQGALSFITMEMVPIVKDGVVVGLSEPVYSRADAIIENFMIAANSSMTHYLWENHLPALRRIVRTPKRWDRIVELAKEYGEVLPPSPNAKALEQFLLRQLKRDPMHYPDLSLLMIKLIGRGEYILARPGERSLGHFDLALREYAHTTAPNRRYPDLIMQRLLKSHLYHEKLPYTMKQLAAIALRCTEKEDDAAKVERRMRKSAAAMLLSQYIGTQYKAIVTGTSAKGTWVRVMRPPIEGKLIKGFKGLDVGDQLNVKLVDVDVSKGYIDFTRV